MDEVTSGGQSDADELARARERLRKVEREMRVVFESMSDAVFIVESVHSTFQYLNPQAEKMFGRTHDELVGRNIWAAFPAEAADGIAKGHYETAVATQQTVSFETYYSPLDRWIEVRAYPNPGGVAVYVKDISERKLIEQNLRAAEARFRRVFDLQFQFIAVVSPAGRIQEINELPLPMIAVTREQIIGELFWEAPWWTHLPETRRIWREQFDVARESDSPVLFDVDFHTADGSMRHASNVITAVRDDAGALECFIVQGNDVTAQRHNQHELKRTNRALKLLSRCSDARFRAQDENQLLNDVCQIAVEVAGYRMAWVGYAENDPGKRIRDVAVAGAELGYLAEIELSWSEDHRSGRGPAGRTIRSGTAQLQPTIDDTAIGFHFVDAALARGYRAVVCLPLRTDGHTFGLLGLYSAEVEHVSPNELNLLQQLADDLAFGISTLRARDELRRDSLAHMSHLEQMQALSAATLAANTRIDDPDLLQTLANALREALCCHQSLIILNRDRDGAPAINAISLSEKYAPWRNFTQEPIGKAGLGTHVRNSGQILRLTPSELEAHPHWHGFGEHAEAHPPLRGWMGVPLLGRDGAAIGMMQVSDRNDGDFNAEDEAIATQFGHMLAVTIERSRLIARLQERDRFFQLSQEMFCIAHPAGRFLQVNAAFSHVLGWSQEELTSRPFAEFVHPEDRELTSHTRAQVIDGERLVGFINRYRHQDGSYRWLEWTSVAAPGGNIYAVARDITRRQEAERQLAQSLEELSARNRELQDFAFIASHDLQEPLRKVRAFAERLVSNYASKLEGPGLEYLERMTSAVTRMQRLIDALLDYSRVLSRPRAPEKVELDTVLRGVLEDLEERLRETGGKVESMGLPTILGDRTQLGQLFQNLISNALKFSSKDVAPHVTISVEPSELQGAPAWTLRFADNGIGIASEFRERIFAPFQRLHGRSEYEGTGIGLAIARRIVERHGGSISAEGSAGAGAVFLVQLPQSGGVECGEAQPNRVV